MAGIRWNRSDGPLKRAVIGLMLIVLLAAGACSGNDSAGSDAATDGGGQERDLSEPGADVAEGEAAGGNGGGSGSGDSSAGGSSLGPVGVGNDALGRGEAPSTAAALPKVGPSVIKTATLDIGVAKDELGDALNEAVAIAGRSGGFVLSSDSGRAASRGSLTMRIPSQRFEAVLVELEGLGKVRSESISGQDVGQDFVDLEARLTNWESQEAVLLKLMDRAATVQDTIRVQSELSRVQLQIEQIRGRLRFLEDQTSYGTITAKFGPVAAPAPSTPGRFAKAWERAVDLMQGFVESVIVASGVVLPLALLALLIYGLFRTVRPRLSA